MFTLEIKQDKQSVLQIIYKMDILMQEIASTSPRHEANSRHLCASSVFRRYASLLTDCIPSSLAGHKATVNNPAENPRKLPATTSLRK